MIEMRVEGKEVIVQYGNLGAGGSFTLFAKSGKMVQGLEANGGMVRFDRVESLFA